MALDLETICQQVDYYNRTRTEGFYVKPMLPLITPEQVLCQLDASESFQERLMGADWLEERGYAKEASFYRWVVAAQLEPNLIKTQTTNYYRWLSRLVGKASNPCYAKGIITNKQIWENLQNGFPVYYGNSVIRYYQTRSQAIAFLRQAFIDVYHS